MHKQLLPYRWLSVPLVITLTAGPAGFGATNSPPALPHLGRHSLPITTRSAQAQRSFDRGLTLAYSFGHYAAEQEFQKALQADPDCAMAWWGIALVNGPHINFPVVPPDKAARAWEALGHARKLAPQTSPLEQALIEALGKRYANPQPEDRSGLDIAYADAMRAVFKAFPGNADVAALCAEAEMDLHPWDLWKGNQPQPWTPEILKTLEAALQLDPYHPGANHLYLHAVEASPAPARGIPAADRLATLVPDASHMVHMPSHIYARVGKWDKAAEANRKAMKVDIRYRAAYPRPGFYSIYMAHNAHFLAFTAMMRGRSAEAIASAREMVNEVPDEFLKEFGPVVDGYLAAVSEALMRFGKWNEMLTEPAPKGGLPLSTALWHFTRAVAFTALKNVREAKAEQAQFIAAADKVPKDATFGNNAASDILSIAKLVLDGEMAAQAGDLKTASSVLTEAVTLEDNLHYDEPPDWIQPVRHTLGAVLLRAGDAQGAEKIYREDLERYPENGWSLMGLRDALSRQGQSKEAKEIERRFRKAWAQADVTPTATCYCQAAAR